MSEPSIEEQIETLKQQQAQQLLQLQQLQLLQQQKLLQQSQSQSKQPAQQSQPQQLRVKPLPEPSVSRLSSKNPFAPKLQEQLQQHQNQHQPNYLENATISTSSPTLFPPPHQPLPKASTVISPSPHLPRSVSPQPARPIAANSNNNINTSNNNINTSNDRIPLFASSEPKRPSNHAPSNHAPSNHNNANNNNNVNNNKRPLPNRVNRGTQVYSKEEQGGFLDLLDKMKMSLNISRSKLPVQRKELEISGPTECKQVLHVDYDAKSGGFTGLPPEWVLINYSFNRYYFLNIFRKHYYRVQELRLINLLKIKKQP